MANFVNSEKRLKQKDMKTQRIVEILKSGAVDTDVVVKGWVRNKR